MSSSNFIQTLVRTIILTVLTSSSSESVQVEFENMPGCLINIVTESGINQNDISTKFLHLGTTTWTVYQVPKLNFAFDKETIDRDDFIVSLNDGYYLFNFRHSQICIIFVLIMDSFNGTTTAIQNSGYGTSEQALFLIQLPGLENEISTGFQNGLSNSEKISLSQGFYATLAFFTPYKSVNSLLNIVGIYCYSCPPEMGKIKSIAIPTNDYVTPASILTLSKIYNSNGHGHKGIFISSAGTESLTTMWNHESCSLSLGRHEFYKNLGECFNGDLIAVRLISRSLNLTFDFFGFSDDMDNQNWRLVLRASAITQRRHETTFAINRPKVGSTYQNIYKLIYCNYVENAVRKAWNIYFTVFDWNVWFCFATVLITFAIFIYKSLFMALDLFWPFLGMAVWFKHPKCFMTTYSVGALFLYATYSAGVSTDFLFVDVSDTVSDFIKNSYKLYVTEHRNVKYLLNAAAEYQLEGIRRLTGFKDAADIMYPDLEYKFPKNLSSRLDVMVTQKILMLSGEANLGLFTALAQLLEFFDKVVVEDKYVCGTLEFPEYMYITNTGGFTTYGIHSQHFMKDLGIL